MRYKLKSSIIVISPDWLEEDLIYIRQVPSNILQMEADRNSALFITFTLDSDRTEKKGEPKCRARNYTKDLRIRRITR